jgi:hypothetical protein
MNISIQHIPFFLRSRGAPPAPFFYFFSFDAAFSLGHTGLYETEHTSPKKLTFLFLGLEGWDQHRCNPLARLPVLSPVPHTHRQLQSLCREPVNSLGVYVRLYGLCGAFFEEKLGPGVSPDRARKMRLAVRRETITKN